METYLDLDRSSTVIGYDLATEHIDVYFRGGACARYTAPGVGLSHLAYLKALARLGRGLARYLARHPALRSDRLAQSA